jgi:UDP-glucose 4-epimerase
MNILITGGMGYLGSHCAVSLIQAGHKVVLYDSLTNSNADVEQSINKITGMKTIFVQGDIRQTAFLQASLREHHIEIVLHLAGLKSIGESNQVPINYYANNVQGTISLIQAMQDANVKSLVFSSSATVYGPPAYIPIDENHHCKANNPYGRTKLHCEELLRDLASSDPEWSIVALRYFNPAGAHHSGLIGENPPNKPNNLMPYLTRVASGQLPKLNIFGDSYPTSDGTGVRDYIHVIDLAEGHVAALHYLKNNNGWEFINLGTGKGTSVREMIGAFEKASGRKIPFSVGPVREGDVAICYADVQKAEKLLKWKAQRSIGEMCTSAWHHQLKIQ